MAQPELIQFQTADELAAAAATAWLDEITRAQEANRPFTVALSGGRIAATLFTEFSRQAKQRNSRLSHVHFFWADERCVPPEHADSNFRVANEQLFSALGIAPDRVHRIRGELSPETAAQDAEAELRGIVPSALDGQPILDLVLLGMGEDGHVASLFPGEPRELASNPAAYRAVTAPKPPPQRVTLGYGVLAAAGEVWVLISGAGKEGALRESVRPQGKTPLARVLRSSKHARLFCELQNLPSGLAADAYPKA